MRRGWMRLWREAVTWPVLHPTWTLCAAAVVCVLCALGASRLRPEPALDSMFDAKDPASRALMTVLREFAAAEEMLLLVSTPQNQPANPDRLLSYARELEKAVAASPELSEVCDGVAYRADPDMMRFFREQLVPSGLYYLNDEQLEKAKERLSREGMQEQIAQNEALMSAPGPAATIARITLADPLRLHEFLMAQLAGARPFETYQNSDALLTPDGKSLLIRVRGNQPPSEIEYAKRFSSLVEQVAKRCNSSGLDLEFAGAYPIAAASERAIRADMVASVTSSVIALQVFFVLVYRRPLRMFLLAFLPVAMGVLIGFGAQSLFADAITPLTGVIGAILAGLAIDYSVHLISDYESHRRMGMSAREASGATVVAIAPALLAAWVTSAIGFAAVGTSSVPAIRGFAVLGLLGLTGAFLSALFVLPCLVALTDWRSAAQVNAKPQARFGLAPLLFSAHRHRLALIAVSCIALVACAVILVQSKDGVLPLETDLTVMHPRPNAPLAAQAKIASRFGASPDPMIVHLQAETPDELLHLAHEARRRLARSEVRQAGGIASSFGLADLLPDPDVSAKRSAMSAEQAGAVANQFREVIGESSFDPAAYEDYATFLQTLLTRESPPGLRELMGYRSLAMMLLSSRDVKQGTMPTQALMLVFPRTSLDTRQERGATIEAIRSAVSDLPGVTLTGVNVLGHDAEDTVRRDLPRVLLIALCAVVAYLAVHFRRPGPVLISLLPMATSLLVLLAMARLADVRLNLINLVAAPLLVGINVDYGIFVVTLVAGMRHKSLDELIGRISATCHGIMVCAATTVLGFGTLYFTSVPAIASLGFATAVGVTACFVLVMTLVLPIALVTRQAAEAKAALTH